MNYILNEDDQEPAMQFEGLARFAFNCDRGGGPNNIADASVFDNEFIPKITPDGLIITHQLIDALIDNPNVNSKDQLVKIKSSLSGEIVQDNAIGLIEYLIKTTKE